MDGIWNGFNIVNLSEKLSHKPVISENYKSATNKPVCELVEKQIKVEIEHGHYKLVTEKPTIVSAIGAIPKKDNKQKIRIIHDCSRPSGNALNDYASTSTFKYQNLQDAVDVITPGCYLAKLDLSNAYRSVKIHPSNYNFTGLKWKFKNQTKDTYMVDTRLPFGASKSPEIFNKLTQAVCKIMAKRGKEKVIAYLDDFLVVSQTFQGCMEMLTDLMQLVRELGFSINYNKIEGPSKQLTFLGISLDTESMSMSLPVQKLEEFKTCVQTTLTKKSVTKRQIQSLIGKLNWCTQCVYGGRFHMRRLIDKVIDLKCSWHRTRVTKDMKDDLKWWENYMKIFNGSCQMVDARPGTPVSIDSCPVAAGAVFHKDWIYTSWENKGHISPLHINFKEVLALEPAVHRWSHLWTNKKVYIHCDNMAAVSIINRGSCRNRIVMSSLRRIFWKSAIFNFRLKAVYYPGIYNELADTVSRLHEPKKLFKLKTLFSR